MRNEGPIDRILRGVVAVAAVVLALVVGAGSGWGIVLWIIAAILGVTALIGMCPIYQVLGISTDAGHQH